jgi:hypothetical protein
MKKSGFGFWFRDNKKALKELDLIEDVLLKENIKFKKIGFAIDFEEEFENEDLEDKRVKEVKNIMLNNNIENYVIYRNRE